MRAKTIQIYWHDRQPIFSCHFEPLRNGNDTSHSHRLATAGGDGNIRLWRVYSSNEPTQSPKVEYLCTLTRHTGAVNVVRFSPVEEILATAGDDGTVLLWKQGMTPKKTFGEEEDTDQLEFWYIIGSLRQV
jgi:chromatin assembly factor 1 subunit B